jgi:hypothetical protein
MRVFAVGMVATAGLGMMLLATTRVEAQALTADMLAPSQGGFAPAAQSPLRRIAGNEDDRVGELRTARAPSRIGRPPVYTAPAASGAFETGFDSLNRKRQKPKLYPGTPKPKFVGPGNPPIQAPPPPPAKVTAPVAPAVAGAVAGQPPRRRLKVDDDPFGNVGFHTGSFLTKAAVEVGGGYDSNPGRLNTPKGSAFYKVSPELQAVSDWSRHAVAVDLRGSFTGYDRTFPSDTGLISPVPTRLDRPEFNGKITGRLDVTRDTRINSQLRLRVGTDNPGSPNVQAGLAKYPLYATSGATLGVEQDINRLQVSLSGTVDHTAYQNSSLTDGTIFNNDDRNFNQYGGIARVSYDLMPGLKPFAEVEGDTRAHQTPRDRWGYARNSTGGYAKAGTTFEFSRLLTGEIAAGYALRNYEDVRLSQMKGMLTSASLIWTASGLTTVRFDATSSIDETTLPGVSGSLSRDFTLTVDHAFRRWLIGTAKVGYGTSDYEGARFDKRYFAEADLVYKLSRTFHIKASVRRDWLDSSIVNASSAGTVVMLGVRVQR